ncbi:nicastrin [Ciona intestinalis]
MKLLFPLWTIFILGLSCDFVFSQTSKVYKLIYKDFDVNSYDKCIRLLNGTSEIGCQSKNGGNTGAIYHINSTARITDFLQKSHLKNYIPLVDVNYFNNKLIQQFISSGKVQGVLVYEPEGFVKPTNSWSPELKCPKERFGLYNASYGPQYECKPDNNPWNPPGDGLTEQNIPFPIFHILQSEAAQEIIQCYNKYNSKEVYPLCSMQMKSHMFGAVDAPTCIRRTTYQTTLTPQMYCDAMGGWNTIASLKPLISRKNKTKSDSTILVTAALDSRAFMMLNTAPGNSLATGFITLLAVAKAMGGISEKQKSELNKNIMFVLFDGEAFDNIGSTRTVFDMQQMNFPVVENKAMIQPAAIKLEDADSIVEIGELGHVDSQLYVHTDPISAALHKSRIDQIIAEINNNAQDINATKASPSVGLVPSSLQTFLKSRNLPGVVITDYDKQTKNKYFFSRYDELRNLNINYNENTTDEEMLQLLQPLAQKLSNVALATAKMLYLEAAATSIIPPEISLNTSLVTEMLFCYLYKANCSLFTEATSTNSVTKLPNFPYNRYVTVFQTSATGLPIMNNWGVLSRNLLAIFTGKHLPDNSTTCKPSVSTDETTTYFYFNGKLNNGTRENFCVKSSSFVTKALAPAIEDNELTNNVENYGLWAESRWTTTTFNLRMFLQHDEVNQGMTLLAGLLVLLVSFTVVYIVDTKAETLFQPAGVI